MTVRSFKLVAQTIRGSHRGARRKIAAGSRQYRRNDGFVEGQRTQGRSAGHCSRPGSGQGQAPRSTQAMVLRVTTYGRRLHCFTLITTRRERQLRTAESEKCIRGLCGVTHWVLGKVRGAVRRGAHFTPKLESASAASAASIAGPSSRSTAPASASFPPSPATEAVPPGAARCWACSDSAASRRLPAEPEARLVGRLLDWRRSWGPQCALRRHSWQTLTSKRRAALLCRRGATRVHLRRT